MATTAAGGAFALLAVCAALTGCGGSGSAVQARAGTYRPVRRTAISAAAAVHVPPISPTDIPNFHVVHPSLLRGGRPTATGLAQLKARGVRTIVDLEIAPRHVAEERRQAEGMGLQFINLPMSSKPPTRKQVSTFLSAVRGPSTSPVFVHCQHGADRTGAMVGIYRVKYDHWPFDRTYREMLHYGFKPYYHPLRDAVRQAAAPGG